MTFQQLEYIVALDNYRHFVTAANHCFVTQPTLTMQVQKLEEEIGIKIFDRSNKPLKPTKAGEQIISKARLIVNEMKQLKDFVNDETSSLEGEFTLGIIPTIAPFLLPLFLPKFLDISPKTYLIIKELETDEIINGLQKGTIDMGILATPLEEKNIREIPVFYEPFLLYLPKNHVWTKEKTIDIEELNLSELLVLEEGHCFREQAIALCGNLKDYKHPFQYESGSIGALKGLVNQGIGYTLVPELAVMDEINKNYVKRFTDKEPVREISLVVNYHFTKEAILQKIHETIKLVIPLHFKKSKNYIRVQWR